MPKGYTKEQLQQLYSTLPLDLKRVIFSKETAKIVYTISTKNGLRKEQIVKLAHLIGDVLLGLLSPREFQSSLERNLGITEEKAKNLFQQINRFIFYPVRESLSKLYKETVSVEKKAISPPPAYPQKDIYREPIE